MLYLKTIAFSHQGDSPKKLNRSSSATKPGEIPLKKITVRASLVAVMLLLVSAFGNAACTGGGSLSGWYGMLVSGTGPSGLGQYVAGAVYFDGNCNIS